MSLPLRMEWMENEDSVFSCDRTVTSTTTGESFLSLYSAWNPPPKNNKKKKKKQKKMEQVLAEIEQQEQEEEHEKKEEEEEEKSKTSSSSSHSSLLRDKMPLAGVSLILVLTVIVMVVVIRASSSSNSSSSNNHTSSSSSSVLATPTTPTTVDTTVCRRRRNDASLNGCLTRMKTPLDQERCLDCMTRRFAGTAINLCARMETCCGVCAPVAAEWIACRRGWIVENDQQQQQQQQQKDDNNNNNENSNVVAQRQSGPLAPPEPTLASWQCQVQGRCSASVTQACVRNLDTPGDSLTCQLCLNSVRDELLTGLVSSSLALGSDNPICTELQSCLGACGMQCTTDFADWVECERGIACSVAAETRTVVIEEETSSEEEGTTTTTTSFSFEEATDDKFLD